MYWKTNIGLRLRTTTLYVVIFYQYLLVATALGFSGVMLPQMRNGVSGIRVDENQASWIASFLFIASPVGAVLFGVIMDKLGRKRCMQLTYVPLIVSYIGLFTTRSVMQIYICRIIAGLAWGIGTGASSVYVCETSSPSSRGFLLSFYAIIAALGLLLCTVLAQFMTWQMASGVLALLSVAGLIILTVSVPESPVWLNQHGRHEEASVVYDWFGLDPTTVEENQVTDDKTVVVNWRTFIGRSVWLPTLLVLWFFVIQIGSGFLVTWCYIVDFAVYMKIPVNPVVGTVCLAVFRMMASVTNSAALQGVGRKTLTIASGTGMSTALGLAAVYMQAYGNDSSNPVPWFTLVCLVSFVSFSAIGLATLPWALCAEVFPPHVSGIMNGVMYAFVNLMIFSAVKMFPLVVARFGFIFVLWTFFTFSVMGTMFGAFVMPETLNKTKEEILLNFRKIKHST